MEKDFEEHETDTEHNKCPNCGANMVYDVKSTDLKCGHCGTTIDFLEDDKVARRAMTDDILKNRGSWKEGAVFQCSNCGAKEVLHRRDIAKTCAFCGSNHIVSIEELAGIKPDSIIPFQIDKQNAIERFSKWIKGRLFAPKGVKRFNRVEQFNALYSSSWSFSALTESSYRGTLGRRTTSSYNGKTVTSTRWFKVSGNVVQEYKDFFVQSGDRIPSKMFARIKPFNLSLVKVYRQEYLSGVIAEHYIRNIEICFNDFSQFVKRDLRNKILNKHNADTVSNLSINTTYKNKQFNYVLLPIYIANYTYRKKLYNFYVNGASGKVVGKYPLSMMRIALFTLGFAAIACAVASVVLFR